MGVIAKAGTESEKRDATEELVMGGVYCCCCEDVEEREEVDPLDGHQGGLDLVVQSDGTCWRCCHDMGGSSSSLSCWSMVRTCWKWRFRWCGMTAVKKCQVTLGPGDMIVSSITHGLEVDQARLEYTKVQQFEECVCVWGSICAVVWAVTEW